jgi:hypothetical protein
MSTTNSTWPDPGREPGPTRWEGSTNRLSYSAAYLSELRYCLSRDLLLGGVLSSGSHSCPPGVSGVASKRPHVRALWTFTHLLFWKEVLLHSPNLRPGTLVYFSSLLFPSEESYVTEFHCPPSAGFEPANRTRYHKTNEADVRKL